jgi:hypothetical protein
LENTFCHQFVPGIVIIRLTGLYRLVETVAAVNTDAQVNIIATTALGDPLETTTRAFPANNLIHAFFPVSRCPSSIAVISSTGADRTPERTLVIRRTAGAVKDPSFILAASCVSWS